MHARSIKPIGYISTDFNEKFGIPRQSGRAPSAKGIIRLQDDFNVPDAVRGLENFSHIWLIFDFSAVHTENLSPLVRPPRLGGNKKVGVFASRSPFRPNFLGLSSVKLEKTTFDDGDVCLVVSGADLLDGTPVYDIKPYIPFSDCHTEAIGGYSDENACHKLKVEIPDSLKDAFPEDKLQTLIECLSDDPRPSYQNDDREYGMRFSNKNVKFIVQNDTVVVIDIK